MHTQNYECLISHITSTQALTNKHALMSYKTNLSN